jgi:hypothetical protein
MSIYGGVVTEGKCGIKMERLTPLPSILYIVIYQTTNPQIIINNINHKKIKVMLKANELRIGNYYMFADSDGIVCRQVKEIKHNQFGLLSDYDGVNFEICRPLNITEEWLPKFGFTIKDTQYAYLNLPNKGAYIYINHNGTGIALENDEFELSYPIELKYIHQLQNLYFALTNTELTIK